MALREVLNKNPKTSAIIGVGLTAVAVGWIVWMLRTDGGRASSDAQQLQAWYTTDDGATWFADEMTKVAPFQTADGKTAVKAVVFECGHGKKFVAYLERNTPAAQLAAQVKQGDASPYAGQMAIQLAGIQVKPPKTGSWIVKNDPAAIKILTPVCPEGSQDNIEPVLP